MEQKKLIGFATMTQEQRREIASKGGKAAHIHGTAHKFNSVTAGLAGRKGAEAKRRLIAAKLEQENKL